MVKLCIFSRPTKSQGKKARLTSGGSSSVGNRLGSSRPRPTGFLSACCKKTIPFFLQHTSDVCPEPVLANVQGFLAPKSHCCAKDGFPAPGCWPVSQKRPQSPSSPAPPPPPPAGNAASFLSALPPCVFVQASLGKTITFVV